MKTIMLTFAVMCLLVGAMAIGVMFKRKPITGTCGGLNAVGLKGECEICGGDMQKCEENSASAKPSSLSSLAYDASKKRID